MTEQEQVNEGLLLAGLDGANPLAFLASIGTAVVARGIFPEVRLGWKQAEGGWRPVLQCCVEDAHEFSTMLLEALKNASMAVFDVDKKMPFDVSRFSKTLQSVQDTASITNRRDADLMAGFGTELYPDEKGNQFQDSQFRMVRSGDSNGQGLPFYVQAIRKATTLDHIQRALFHPWDYRDKEVPYSLRWDPIEDQRYAQRWGDPSKSKDGGSMLAANSLAVEALQFFPTLISRGREAQTTGFQRIGPRTTYFVWPIWTPMIGTDTLRSLLALPDLGTTPSPRLALAKMGIAEVYRSQRIRPNKYYSNFSPAQPV